MTHQPSLIFTRYLYIKEEVELTLLVSILNKSDDSIFWAYELYYSGFKDDLFSLLWKIYYYFFATLNPAFETYLFKKQKELTKSNDVSDDKIISIIIQTLLFRPFNTDIFLLKTTCSLFEMDINYHQDTEKITHIDDFNKNMRFWLQTDDYRSLGQWLLNINKDNIDIIELYKASLNVFELTNPKLVKEFISIVNANLCVDKNIILLVKIMQLFSKKHNLKKGKSMYVNVEPEDIIPYETIIGSHEIKHYRILEKACICGIDDFKHLSLFKLKRNKYNLKERYLNNWLYYASFSPIWSERIKHYNGIISHSNQTVLFHDDELMEQFYTLYGLEPDEQKEYIQNKSISPIEKKYDWTWFCNTYKNNGLFHIWEEELAEFDFIQF